MPWSKGAVVIVKHGDQEWADSMEQTVAIKLASKQEVEELRKENEALKRDKKLAKIHDDRFTNIVIKEIERKHGKIKRYRRWKDILLAPWALFVYAVSLFTNKYLIIKGTKRG